MKCASFSILVSILLFTAACRKDITTATDTNLTALSKTNVAYGADVKQQLDFYLPAGRSSATTKVIIMIHGGSWTGGDKADFNLYLYTLKKRFPDYAFFNINYRLATLTDNVFPTQENDVKAAVEFIYKNR